MSDKLKTVEEAIKSFTNQDFQKSNNFLDTLRHGRINPDSKNQQLSITIVLNDYNSAGDSILLKIIDNLELLILLTDDTTNNVVLIQNISNLILRLLFIYGAVIAIDERLLNHADDFLDKAILVSGDIITNYISMIGCLRGHVAYCRKQYESAMGFYCKASSVWKDVKYINTTLLSEIIFYRFKAIIAAPDDNMLEEMQILYNSIIGIPQIDYYANYYKISKDESLRRRLRARLIRLGQIGNKIDDFLFVDI